MHFHDYVSGGKNCIELIAVYAAIQELKKMNTKSYLRCFKRFITYIQKFDDLNICFETNDHQIVDKNRPYVIDPVNPYNNLASNWDDKSIQSLTNYADETNRRLNIFADLRVIRLDETFMAQPVYRPDMRQIFAYDSTRSQFLRSRVTYNSLLCDLKVRNSNFYTNSKLIKSLEILKNYLWQTINASKASGYNENQMNEVVQNMSSRQILDDKRKSISAENEDHENYDLTFTIPFDSPKNSQIAIHISYRL